MEGCEFYSEVVQQGRCMILRIVRGDIALNVVNVHIEPDLSFADKSALLLNIIGRSRDCGEAFIYAGDWNFTALDDDRLELGDLTFGPRDDRLADLLMRSEAI